MYSSLHNHDFYSLLDGYGSPKEMLDRAKEIGLKAYATTNHGNAYAHISYDLIKKDYPDIKMIYGCELYECEDIAIKDKDNKYFHLICLIRNEQGRKDLNKVIEINKEYEEKAAVFAAGPGHGVHPGGLRRKETRPRQGRHRHGAGGHPAHQRCARRYFRLCQGGGLEESL